MSVARLSVPGIYKGNVSARNVKSCGNYAPDKCSPLTTTGVYDPLVEACVERERMEHLTKFSTGTCYDAEAPRGLADYLLSGDKEDFTDPATDTKFSPEDLQALGLGYLDAERDLDAKHKGSGESEGRRALRELRMLVRAVRARAFHAGVPLERSDSERSDSFHGAPRERGESASGSS